MIDGNLHTLGYFLFFLATDLLDLEPESLNRLNALNAEK